MYLKTDLLTYNLKELNCKFDVILIEPPLEEYQRTCGATNVQLWNWDQVNKNSIILNQLFKLIDFYKDLNFFSLSPADNGIRHR